MPIKWGSTYITAVKWGSTTCTAVYWGSTLVFPTGGFDGGVLSPPFNGGMIYRADGGKNEGQGNTNISPNSNGVLYMSRYSNINNTYDSAHITLETRSNTINFSIYTKITIIFSTGDSSSTSHRTSLGLYTSSNDNKKVYINSITSGTQYILSNYITNGIPTSGTFQLSTSWYYSGVKSVTNDLTINKILLS